MQEYIEKEAVMEVFKTAIELPWARLYFHDAIEALPTTVHHECKIGDEAEFLNDENQWEIGRFQGYIFETGKWKIRYPERMRPLSEHPDIIQARELASKHWMILIPKE